VDATKARRFVHELARGEKRLCARTIVQYETDDRSEPPHLTRGDGMRGVPGQTRVSNASDVGTFREKLREGERVVALPRKSEIECGERPVREPDLHRPWYRADLTPPRMELLDPALFRDGNVAKDDVAMSAKSLGVGRDREIGPQGQRTLAEHSRRRIVHGDQDPSLARRGDERLEVARVETRVARGFEPEELRTLEMRLLRVARRGAIFTETPISVK